MYSKVVTVLAAVIAISSVAFADSFEEKIIGDNDLVVVGAKGENLDSRYRDLIDAFGKLTTGCTVTHVGNGIVLTAGHCFKATEVPQTDVPCSRYLMMWGDRQGTTPYLVSRCRSILSMQTNDDIDYAILLVDNPPHAYVEVELNSYPDFGSRVTLFGHPRGRPLEWSGRCSVEPARNATFAGKYEFTHQCDTLGGNSGSTIIDDVTLKVIGIHDGGIAPWNYGSFVIDTPLLSILSGSDNL